jgi:hypothetical protein
MGQWSGMTLSTNLHHCINIVTVYQSTRSNGIHTAYQQQRNCLLTKGIENPQPRKVLLDDLATQITRWNNKGNLSIITTIIHSPKIPSYQNSSPQHN